MSVPSGLPRHLTVPHLEAVLDATGDGILVRGPDGRLLWGNAEAARQLGMTIEELQAAPVDELAARYEVFDAAGSPYPRHQFPGRRALSGDPGPLEVLLRFRFPGAGADRWALVRGQRLTGPAGEVLGSVTVFRDVTARQEAVTAQQAMEDRLEFLASLGPQLLATSLDARGVLELIADFVVPRLADYCSVREMRDDGTASRVALRHADPAKAAVLTALERYPPWTGALIADQIQAGLPYLAPELPRELLEKAAVDEEHLRLLEALDPGSLVAVPVRARDRTVGIIAALASRTSRPFDRADVLLIQDLARRAGLAIDNARLYAQEQRARAQAERARAEQAFLLEVSTLLAASLDFGVGLERLAGLVAGHLCDICVVDLQDLADGTIRRVAAVAAAPEDQPIADVLRERFAPDAGGNHPAVQAMRTGTAQFSGEVTEVFLAGATRDADHLRLVQEWGFCSYLSVPLAARGRMLGALTLMAARRSGRSYAAADLALVEDLARRAALALDNARLYQETELQAMLLDSQSDAAIEGVLVVSPGGRVVSHNRQFAEMWAAPRAILEAGDADALLRLVASQVANPIAFERQVRQLRTDRTVRSRDELDLRDGRVFDRWTVPLFGADGVHRGRAWYFRDVTAFKLVQEERARLWRAERAARLEGDASRAGLQFLLEASTLLAGSLDVHLALAGLADLVVTGHGRMWAHRCDIDLVGVGGVLERVASAGPSATYDGSPLPPGHPLCPTDGLPAHVIRTAAAVSLPEADGSPARLPYGERETLAGYGIGAYVGVPLVARGQVIGAIGLARGLGEAGAYSAVDIALVQDLARRVALALDHAHLFDAQRHIAVTLQASLLPPALPEIPGVELASRYRSAIATSEVGGDFYDLYPAGAEAWAVVMGDISGKGVEAAALTAMARYTVRAASREHRQPREVLSLLNQAMLEEQSSGRFLTIAFGRLRRREGTWRLTVACGGHPPPLLLRANGTVETAGRPGTLLGFVPNPDLPEKVNALGPGDAVVFYTDGLTDVRGPGGTFGEERLRAALAECRGERAEVIAGRLETEVLAFLSGEARDDLALLVLRVSPDVRGALSGAGSPAVPAALGAVGHEADEPDGERDDGDDPQ
ncbi:MAG TPA: SpoIIE family protein phosphatase [Actinomycetota bacterium]|nr:SpoIIE family protein phosphatase [Actinomycetota bacterium]